MHLRPTSVTLERNTIRPREANKRQRTIAKTLFLHVGRPVCENLEERNTTIVAPIAVEVVVGHYHWDFNFYRAYRLSF